MMIRFCVIAAWLMLPSLVQAQMAPQQGTADEQKACQSDARRHCRAVLEQGDMAVLTCLQQHRNKLTRGCKEVLTRHGQ